MAPLLLIAVAIAGFVFGHDAALGYVANGLDDFVGRKNAMAIQDMILHARKPSSSIFSTATGIVMLIVIKPKDLPGVMRQVGRTVAQLRRMAAEFQGQFHEAMREAELQDLKKDVETMSRVSIDPLGSVRDEIARTRADIEAGLATTPAPAATTTAEAPAATPDDDVAATPAEAEQLAREESARIAHDLPGVEVEPVAVRTDAHT